MSQGIAQVIASAQEGDADKQLRLGNRYFKGNKGCDQNYERAAEWFQKAAEQGHAKAQMNVAFCFKKGKGVNQDPAKAFEWYKKAANQGLADAQICLGGCFQHGDGVAQDLEEAARLFQLAADQGAAKAQDLLISLKSSQEEDARGKSKNAKKDLSCSGAVPSTIFREQAVKLREEAMLAREQAILVRELACAKREAFLAQQQTDTDCC